MEPKILGRKIWEEDCFNIGVGALMTEYEISGDFLASKGCKAVLGVGGIHSVDYIQRWR
jgi:hypothetical protein